MNNLPIQYKIATPDSLNGMMELNLLCFPPRENYSEACWADIIKEQKSCVALDQSKVVGYIAVKPLIHYPGDHVYSFAVHPNYRKLGIGTKLFTKIAGMTTHGVISLHVRAQNQSALNLYYKQGLQAIACKFNYYGDGEDGLLLTNGYLK